MIDKIRLVVEPYNGFDEVYGPAVYKIDSTGTPEYQPFAAVDHLEQDAEKYAVLFAAAPELLEACKATLRLCELWMAGALAQMGCVWDSEEDHPPALIRARSAIAKAEGR